MSSTKKNIFLVILVVAVSFFVLVLLCWGKEVISVVYDMLPARQRLFRETEEKLRTVKLGMTREQVRTIVGEPMQVAQFKFLGKKLEQWYFPQDVATASDATVCTFDVDSGRVIEVQILGKIERIDEAFEALRHRARTGEGAAETKNPVGAE